MERILDDNCLAFVGFYKVVVSNSVSTPVKEKVC